MIAFPYPLPYVSRMWCVSNLWSVVVDLWLVHSHVAAGSRAYVRFPFRMRRFYVVKRK